MSVLQEICEKKALYVAKKAAQTTISELEVLAKSIEPPRSFINALNNANGPALIAEVKKASPSKGLIRENFDAVEIGKTYEDKGAHCISVLTDEPYFQGSDNYFIAVKKAVNIPLLRKDFMIDPYQIVESRTLGADCILLIMAALSDTQANELYSLAKAHNMDVLVEVHNEEELERACLLEANMIGINNRNLKTLEVDVQTSHELFNKIPDNVLKVAESGLADAQTIQSLHETGYKAFLIGESLTREDDIAAQIDILFPNSLTRKKN